MTVMRAARTLGQLSGWTLSNLPMQKVLYIAQSLHLAEHGEPLFPENFEAWDYGPVVPAVYQMAKRFGRDPVQDVFEAQPFAKSDAAFFTLCDAWEFAKHRSAAQLVADTHIPGGAWDQVYDEHRRNGVIPTNLILREVSSEARATDEDVEWALGVAAEFEKTPAQYLDDAHERLFRTRLFGENRPEPMGSC